MLLFTYDVADFHHKPQVDSSRGEGVMSMQPSKSL